MMRRFLKGFLGVGFCFFMAATGAQPPVAGLDGLSEHEKIGHVLNRLGYGPSLSDSARVRKMGVDAYIEEQLQPGPVDSLERTRMERAFAPNQLKVIPSSAAFLVRAGDRWHYFKGRQEPPQGWQGFSLIPPRG